MQSTQNLVCHLSLHPCVQFSSRFKNTVVLEIFVRKNIRIFNFCIDYFRNPIQLQKEKITKICPLRKLQLLIATHLLVCDSSSKVYLTLG